MKGSDELLFGLHAVRHALEQPSAPLRRLLLQRGRQGGEIDTLLELAGAAGIEIEHLDKAQLDRMTGNAAHQGIALLRGESGEVSDLDSLLEGLQGRTPLLLVLDGVQDPHNLGACLRSANAAGAHAIIVPKDNAVAVNATVRKVASGAAEHTPVIRVTNLARCLRQLQQAGIWIIGTASDAGESLYSVDLTIPLALVLGGEGKGLRQNTRKQCDRLVALPMHGAVESLNVSVSAGICLYEAVRQRG